MSGTPRFEELYPDLVEAGGIPAALRRALVAAGSGLPVSGTGWARVEKGPRFSQVCPAALERLFLYDFWDRGVMLAGARTPHLPEVAASVHAWVEEGVG